MHALGNTLEPAWAMVHRIHAGNYRQQHLGCTDIRCRFLAADMLLAGLQSQPVRWFAIGVLRQTHQSTGQVAL